MFIRKYWLPLSVFLIVVVGVGLYYLQARPPKDPIIIYKTTKVEKPTQPQALVGDPSQGGHFHEDGTWHAGPHEMSQPLAQVKTPQNGQPIAQPQDKDEYKVPANWNELSQEERTRLWAEAYRAKWGDDPPQNSEYRHIVDSRGRIRRHYRNRPLLTQHEVRIGFAPHVDVLQDYLKLYADYRGAKDLGNTARAESLLAKMREMQLRYQGEIPARPYYYAYYGDFISPEDEKRLDHEATRELYELMGIGHLFEFYENQFFNQKTQ